MKKLQLTGIARATAASRRLWVFGLAMATMGLAHADPVKIEVWHTLSGANKAEFEKLAKQYNKEQKDVQVALRGFASQAALKQETGAAIKAKQRPNLIQLEDNHSPEVVAEHQAIMPMYQLLAKYPVKDLKWFLPDTAGFTRDARGRLLAFPWMAEVPVMYYNTALYKKAGLNPNQPARTWTELQAELLKLRDVADVECPYASSDQVSVHLENLAPVNNQFYASNGNGLGAAKQAPTMQFDILYMRHISLMVSWKRSLLFTASSNDKQPDQQFAKGTCGVLTSSSSALGDFLNTRGLSFGVAPLPYYDQATPKAGRPFVSGSALWALNGNPVEQDKATAQFLGWLAKPVVAAEWHQRTGFLPLTDAAFRASDVSFYDKIPGAQQLVASMRTPLPDNGRGFRIANYERIETVLDTSLTEALNGTTPPMAALNKAVNQARTLATQR